ncbi:hypothetical protein ONE63_006886 [Megalurothrips usitatus]|uniref:Uncharacterized protein n=1 Tax=Megalurothrips usitatus TaxID=439358 RepID=A0AAV7XUI3_9NEOP|nr:hypothetical protein ONE63_006886 [Megalurothrips usitatus]
MHLESTLSLKDRRPSPGLAALTSPAANPAAAVPAGHGVHPGEHRRSLRGAKGKAAKGGKVKGRAPLLGEVGKRQTLNVFAADGRDVSAEVGSEEAVVDETAFVKQPSVIFTRGKKGMFYTLLLLDYHKEEGCSPHHRLHWLITDIPGQEFASGDLSDGLVLAALANRILRGRVSF